MNELASCFRSKELVLELKKNISQLFKSRRVARGKEVLKAIALTSDSMLAEPVLEMLIENSVLEKEKPASHLQNYLITFNKQESTQYFKREAEAAEVLETALIPRLERKDEFRVLATFPDDPYFQRSRGDAALIYPTIKRLIQKSSKQLDIVNPFFDAFGTKKIIPDLLTAARKGAIVRIVTRGSFDFEEGRKNKDSELLLFKAFEEQGLASRLQIRDYYKRSSSTLRQIFAVHSKLLISDSEECYLGSANITSHSLYSNFETGVLFNGKEVGAAQALFNRLWNAAKPVHSEEVQK